MTRRDFTVTKANPVEALSELESRNRSAFAYTSAQFERPVGVNRSR